MSITGGEIAELNPYRYRGYRYDSETGLYYLQSRYYNPEWGRFINADIVIGDTDYLHDHNWYIYCGNNPITRSDYDGEAWVIAGAIVGALVGGTIGAVVSYKRTGKVDWRYVAGGAVAGALIGSGAGLLAKTVVATKAAATTTAAASGSGVAASEVLSKGPSNTVVYKGIQAGKQVYVGISKNLPQRVAAHGSRFHEVKRLTNEPLTRHEARAVEQVLIEFGRSNGLGYENIRNSIAVTNPIYQEAIRWGTTYCNYYNLFPK